MKTRAFQKIGAMLLTVALLFTLLPVTAFTADYNVFSWQELANALSNAQDADNIYINDYITLDDSITLDNGVSIYISSGGMLDTGGHTITNNGGGRIEISNGGTLSNGGGTIVNNGKIVNYGTIIDIGTISGNVPPNIRTVSSLGNGTVSAAYSQMLAADNGPTSWSLSNEPAWLSISSRGVISGTPTTTGTFNFEVTAENAGGSHTKEFSITVAASSEKQITGFSIPGQVEDEYIWESFNMIGITMPYGTDVTSLTPTIVHTGTSIGPASGVEQDFSIPVEYTVTAEDGTTRIYTVYVFVEDPELAVESVTPSGADVSVSTDTLTVTFNQEMDTYIDNDGSIVGSVTIDGGAVLSNPRWSADKTAVTYDLAGLDYDTEYTVTIEDFWAANEGELSEAYIHTFTTEAEPFYTVTYSGNGGSGAAPVEADKAAGETFAAAANTFTAPDGWQFKEWNTEADGTGTGYAEGEAVTMPAENLTLYAVWEKISDNEYKFSPGFDTFTGSGDRTAKANAPYVKFVRLFIDGKELASGNYAVTEGSTVVTLKEAYLKTLANGEYTVTAEFTDGTAVTTLIVDVSGTPKTGDNTNMTLSLLLTGASLTALCGIAVVWKKKDQIV